MKKSLRRIVVLSLFLCSSYAFSQNMTTFVQMDGGVAIENPKVVHIGLEIGKTYKWLDFGLSFNYEGNSLLKNYYSNTSLIYDDQAFNNLIWDNSNYGYYSYSSLNLFSKVDIIRLFIASSCHSVKIGGGIGIVQHTYSNRKIVENDTYSMVSGSSIGLSGLLKLSYEYKLSSKLHLGAYFGGSQYPSVGLLIRGNF